MKLSDVDDLREALDELEVVAERFCDLARDVDDLQPSPTAALFRSLRNSPLGPPRWSAVQLALRNLFRTTRASRCAAVEPGLTGITLVVSTLGKTTGFDDPTCVLAARLWLSDLENAVLHRLLDLKPTPALLNAERQKPVGAPTAAANFAAAAPAASIHWTIGRTLELPTPPATSSPCPAPGQSAAAAAMPPSVLAAQVFLPAKHHRYAASDQIPPPSPASRGRSRSSAPSMPPSEERLDNEAGAKPDKASPEVARTDTASSSGSRRSKRMRSSRQSYVESESDTSIEESIPTSRRRLESANAPGNSITPPSAQRAARPIAVAALAWQVGARLDAPFPLFPDLSHPNGALLEHRNRIFTREDIGRQQQGAIQLGTHGKYPRPGKNSYKGPTLYDPPCDHIAIQAKQNIVLPSPAYGGSLVVVSDERKLDQYKAASSTFRNHGEGPTKTTRGTSVFISEEQNEWQYRGRFDLARDGDGTGVNAWRLPSGPGAREKIDPRLRTAIEARLFDKKVKGRIPYQYDMLREWGWFQGVPTGTKRQEEDIWEELEQGLCHTVIPFLRLEYIHDDVEEFSVWEAKRATRR